VVIQEQVDGLGNFQAPSPVFDIIRLMLIYRGYHNFIMNFDKFLSRQGSKNSENTKKSRHHGCLPKRNREKEC
jgi:hypothetical protein